MRVEPTRRGIAYQQSQWSPIGPCIRTRRSNYLQEKFELYAVNSYNGGMLTVSNGTFSANSANVVGDPDNASLVSIFDGVIGHQHDARRGRHSVHAGQAGAKRQTPLPRLLPRLFPLVVRCRGVILHIYELSDPHPVRHRTRRLPRLGTTAACGL